MREPLGIFRNQPLLHPVTPHGTAVGTGPLGARAFQSARARFPQRILAHWGRCALACKLARVALCLHGGAPLAVVLEPGGVCLRVPWGRGHPVLACRIRGAHVKTAGVRGTLAWAPKRSVSPICANNINCARIELRKPRTQKRLVLNGPGPQNALFHHSVLARSSMGGSTIKSLMTLPGLQNALFHRSAMTRSNMGGSTFES